MSSSTRRTLSAYLLPSHNFSPPPRPLLNAGGLYPSSFITSRVAKFTIAVALCELYNPKIHDPVPHPSYMVHTPRGVWVDHVLVPLVGKNDDVGPTEDRVTEVKPVNDGQQTVCFRLFGVNRRLAPMTAEAPRTYLIKSRIAEALPAQFLERHVLESACIGTVNVPTGGLSSSCSLRLFFGRTEIQAEARSMTGEKRACSISYSSATPDEASGIMQAGGT